MTAERVLVFPSKLLDNLGRFQGYSTDTKKYLSPIFSPLSLHFIDRESAEEDESVKQIIPYVIIRVGGLYMHYERTKKSGEERLHGKSSVGIGGHINQEDGEKGVSYDRGFLREIHEETGLFIEPARVKETIVGMINDDSNPVGRVHFGVVHLLDISREKLLFFSDPAIITPQFASLDHLRRDSGRFESWSQIVLENLPA